MQEYIFSCIEFIFNFIISIIKKLSNVYFANIENLYKILSNHFEIFMIFQ